MPDDVVKPIRQVEILILTGGKLPELLVETALRALVIDRAGDAAAEKTLAEMLRHRKEKFFARWRELRPTDIRAPPEFAEDEKARGFMRACRHYCEEVTPCFVPRAEDRLAKLSVAVTRGEKEPAAFMVYPLKDMPRGEGRGRCHLAAARRVLSGALPPGRAGSVQPRRNPVCGIAMTSPFSLGSTSRRTGQSLSSELGDRDNGN